MNNMCLHVLCLLCYVYYVMLHVLCLLYHLTTPCTSKGTLYMANLDLVGANPVIKEVVYNAFMCIS